MISELTQAILTKYNTLMRGSVLLKNSCPIYFSTAPSGVDYPFTSYYITDNSMSFDSCSDYYDFIVQFSVFDNKNTPADVTVIMDVVNEGFNNLATLSGIEGGLVNIEPVSHRVLQRIGEKGHVGIIVYKVKIGKNR